MITQKVDLTDEVVYLLKLIADMSNWEFDTYYDDLYSEWIGENYWIGDEDVWTMARDLLEKLGED